MKLAFGASSALHAALGWWLLAGLPLGGSGPPEAEAQIAVVFGRGAEAQAAPAPPQAAAVASRPQQPTPPLPPVPDADAPPLAPPAAPAAASRAVAVPPVRLGDGDMGFDVPQRDPGLVEAEADPGNRPPRYPAAAGARHEHGSVLLRIHVGTDGRVADIEILQSSGFADLDQAARDTAMAWHFIPQQRGSEAVPSVRDQQFDFVME